MKALDTNIVVRFLIRDDEQQSILVHQLFKQAEQHRELMLVSNLVLLKTIWVLESVYRVERNVILDTIGELLMLPVLNMLFSAPAI